MIFEFFHTWHEEKLGLMGGISFVLMGIFTYFLYLMRLSTEIMLLAAMVVVFSALTSLFFQLPRIKGVKPGVSTFVGGITLGLAVIFWGYILSLIPPESWEKMGEVAGLTAGLLIASFFGFGFLILALVPPQEQVKHIVEGKNKMGVKEFKEEDDFIDRL